VYPVILSLHMLALALFGGMVLTTDLRLLGLAMRSSPVSNVLYQLRTAKRYGLLLMVTCGILLAACKAEEYYYNIFFHAKLALIAFFIVHALVFRRTVYNRAGEIDTTGRIPWTAKLAAGLSLILRTAIVCMGRGIGYTEPPPGIHAQLWPF
jgi:hypothetical protein